MDRMLVVLNRLRRWAVPSTEKPLTILEWDPARHERCSGRNRPSCRALLRPFRSQGDPLVSIACHRRHFVPHMACPARGSAAVSNNSSFCPPSSISKLHSSVVNASALPPFLLALNRHVPFPFVPLTLNLTST